jgi:CBS domain-containing protein
MVSDVMSKNLITTNPSEEAIIALEKLQKNDLGRLPVVEDDKLVGIISKTDIIKVLNLMRSKN